MFIDAKAIDENVGSAFVAARQCYKLACAELALSSHILAAGSYLGTFYEYSETMPSYLDR